MLFKVHIPKEEIIAKAVNFRGPRHPHKYISRKWNGNRWVYKYRQIRTGKHGHEYAEDEATHSVDIPKEAHEFDYPPEQAYQISEWKHKVDQLIKTKQPQTLNDWRGNKQYTLRYRDPERKRPGRRGKSNPFQVHNDEGRLVAWGDANYIKRWATRNALAPIEVYGVGGLHHTLTPTAATRSGGQRPGWALAKFNKENEFDPYKGHAKDTRHFRNREEYTQWWQAQLEWMLGRRMTPAVDIDRDTYRTRPMTAMLESGLIPWKVEKEKVAYRTGNRKFWRPVWKLDFQQVNWTQAEFAKRLLDEHIGLAVMATHNAINRVFGKDIPPGRRSYLFNEIQEAAIRSLYESIHRYNPGRINPRTGKGYRFATYAGTRMALDAVKAAFKEKHLQREVEAPALEEIEQAKVVRHEWSLDADQRIDVHRAWHKIQDEVFKTKIRAAKDEGVKRFLQKKRAELKQVNTYTKAQHWTQDNDFLDVIVPIEDHEAYLGQKEGKEIFGPRFRAKAAAKKQGSKWRRAIDKYFEPQKKKATKHIKQRIELLQKLIHDWAPNGDLRNPIQLPTLAEKHKAGIQKLFGRQAASEEDRTDIVHKMLLKEASGFFASPGIMDFLGKSWDVHDMLDELLKKALTSMMVDEVRDYVLRAA